MTFCLFRKVFRESIFAALSIVLLSLHVVWSAETVQGEPGGLNGNGSLKRIAAIEILPYNPLAGKDDAVHVKKALSLEEDTFDSKTHVPLYHQDGASRYNYPLRPDTYLPENFGNTIETPVVAGIYKDSFGFGRNCVYVGIELLGGDFTPKVKPLVKAAAPTTPTMYDYEERTHGYYLQQLVKYKQENFNVVKESLLGESRSHLRMESKNLLLVRMVFKNITKTVTGAETNEQLKLDGEAEYLFGVFISGGKEKEESWYLVPDAEKTKILDASRDKLKPGFNSPLGNSVLSMEGYTKGGRFYYPKLFSVLSTASLAEPRLVPFSGADNKDNLRDTMEKRLFGSGHFVARDLDTSITAATNRSIFSVRMFGNPAYFKYPKTPENPHVLACFGDDISTCFDQSEQSFLGFLKKGPTEIDLLEGNENFCS